MKFKNIALLIIFALLIGCGGGKKFGPVLNTIPDTGSEFKLLQEQGDLEFAKMHYMGWYNAVNFYRKALELKKDATDIKEKLFFTYFLKALREPLYFIDNSESRRETHYWAEELNRSISTKNPFSGIVGYLLAEKDPTSPEITEASIREVKDAADTDYKYFLYLKFSGLRMDIFARQKEADVFLRLYPASNLRYFASSQFNDMNSAIEKYPDFFELLLVRGDLAYQAMDIENARRDYLKVLEINRGIPSALVGIGNVYYDIGLIQKALEYYEEVVKTSQDHFTALFKKGVCLHDLGRYDESNIVMDVVAKDGVFEKGDAFYYIALNYFDLKNFPQVETNIRNAELIIPDSFRLNFLAGLYYYQSERYAESRSYFKKANEISSAYPECYYYQGLMDLKEQKMKTALENFLLAAIYYNGFLKDEYQAIEAIAEKNYTPELKLRIKQLREKRLEEDAKNTIQKLESVLDVFRDNNKKAKSEIRRTVQYIKENYLLKITP
jgi:tetratricopeptide (TPR) repeat protein